MSAFWSVHCYAAARANAKRKAVEAAAEAAPDVIAAFEKLLAEAAVPATVAAG